jgi:tetrapyrrole methylase family protein/MazG family protein
MSNDEHVRASADAGGEARGELGWLAGIMRRLLGPGGCPWDQEQTLDSLRPYLIEECYEVLDAIDAGDRDAHTEELGDLLLQIVFQAQLAQVELRDVVLSIGDKLIRRHPHVFGDVDVADADEVLVNWEAIKKQEKGETRRSAIDGVPRSLPALHRAHELTRKAAKVGFRWRSPEGARAKLKEELAEADAAAAGDDVHALRAEVGDALFALAAWARQLGVQPEDALRQANERFDRRFRALETAYDDSGDSLREADEAQLLARWREIKADVG